VANVKISDLTAASALVSGDIFEVSQGSGTLVSRKATATQIKDFVLAAYPGTTSVSTVGTISTGTWQGSVIAGDYGGTGVANTGKSITLGGNFTTSGAYALTVTLIASTAVTLPASGTLATLAGAETFTAKTFGNYTETVYAITDGSTVALDPNNGPIQTWTLGGSRTPTQANWAAGQSITLLVDDGSAATITWTTLAVTWKTGGGTAPTLNTSGYTVILLWKVGTTIYGARVGDA
jgi:hypothetical protein